MLILYTPLSTAFKVVQLGRLDWVIILGLASTGFIVFETKKILTYKDEFEKFLSKS